MTAKVHQNILKTLNKRNPEKDVAKTYMHYIKNVEILNSQNFYFSDFFLHTEKTIFDFELEMNEILKVHFVNRVLKRILKKTTIELLTPEAFSLLLDFYDKWQEDSFVIMKNNFKRQEKLETKSDLKIALSELLKNNDIHFNLEMIRNDIKSHNRNTNDYLELIKADNTLYYIKMSVLSLELLQKYASPKYCIKEGYKSIFENMPFVLSPLLCFDFNPERKQFRTFVILSDMEYLELHDHNNMLTEIEINEDSNINPKKRQEQPIEISYIDKIFKTGVSKDNIFDLMKHEDFSKYENRKTNVSTLSFNIVVKYLLEQNGKNQLNVKRLLLNTKTKEKTAYYIFKFFKNEIAKERTSTKMDEGIIELLNLSFEVFNDKKRYAILTDIHEEIKTKFFRCKNEEIRNLRSLTDLIEYKKSQEDFIESEFIYHSTSLEFFYDKILFASFSSEEKEFIKKSKQIKYLMKNLLNLKMKTMYLPEISNYILDSFSYEIKEIYLEKLLTIFNLSYREDRQQIRHIWTYLKKNDQESLLKLKTKIRSINERVAQNEALIEKISRSYGFNSKYKECFDGDVDFDSANAVEDIPKEKNDFYLPNKKEEEKKETVNDYSKLGKLDNERLLKIINDIV